MYALAVIGVIAASASIGFLVSMMCLWIMTKGK